MNTLIYRCLILLCCFRLSAQESPNVLMIVLDDLNDYIGVMEGHPQAKTPNIDKLANEGVLFNNAHSNVPVCMPSRASFMNGILPTTSGVWGFDNWLKNEMLMECKSLPEYFRENGYKAYQTGKVFHNSKKDVWDEKGVIADYGPMAYDGKKVARHPSCPEAMAELGYLDATFASLADIPNVPKSNNAPGYKGWFNTNWQTNNPFNYVDDANRDLMTDEQSVAWFENILTRLDASKSQDPFFIAVGLIRPHTPLVVPQKYFDLFPLNEVQIPVLLANDRADCKLEENVSKESRGRKAYRALTASYSSKEKALQKYVQAYLASVAFADDMVGKTLKALEESRYNENTIVVLFSDHGYNLGEKEYLFKYALWEESTKVPLIIKHPKYKGSIGKTVAHPVSLVDIYPTLQELCDLKGETTYSKKGAKLDGFSLEPFMKDPETTDWKGPEGALTVISSWKSKKPEAQHLSLRTRQFRYIHYANGSEELYDHSNDPYEWRNIASHQKYAAIKKSHKKALFELVTRKKPVPQPTKKASEKTSTLKANEFKTGYFIKFPEADANRDGILTWAEFKKHRSSKL